MALMLADTPPCPLFPPQQHECLEKHNQALRKEIQGLRDELAWWTRNLRLHERLCRGDCALRPAPEPPDGRGRARGLPGQHEQPGLLQTPGSRLPAQQLQPDPQPRDPRGLLPSPLALLSLGPAAVAPPPAQTSAGPVLPAGPGPLGSSCRRGGLSPSAPAPAAPPQPFGQEPPGRGTLGSSLGPAEWPGSAADPGRQPLLPFPLLASARVHF